MRLHPTSGTEALPLPSGKAPHPLPQRIENRREGTPFAPLPPLVPACLQPVLLTGCFFICLVFLCSWARRALGCRLRPLTAAPTHRIKPREGTPCAPLPPLVPACLQPVLLTGCFFVCLVLPYSWARCTLGCMLDALTAPRRCFIYAFALRFSTMRATAASTSSRDVARFMRTHAPKRSPPNQSP